MAQQTDGSTALFQRLTSQHILSPNYNYPQAFYRALKVMMISYPERRDGAQLPASYQNLDLFTEEIKNLYGMTKVNSVLMSGQEMIVKAEHMYISITVKRFRGGGSLTNPSVVATLDNPLPRVQLNPGTEVQRHCNIRIDTNYDNLGDLRCHENRVLIISMEANNWKQLNELRIVIAHTHPEGFEDWFDFGEGVQLLINVEFKVDNERNISEKDVSLFHMHTIYKMLERRLQDYAHKALAKLGHKSVGYKYKTTHRRPLVDPQSDDMFWSKPSILDNPTVKFIDLQIGVLSYEDSEESVCLCSEWCNWNAFFYYNPMYRFLLVRHYQLYLQNKTTLPNMYLCMSIISGCISQGSYTKAPILLLMNSANYFRHKHHENYLKDPGYKSKYDSSDPSGITMNAVSYNLLKNTLDARERCFDLHVNPLAGVCIESLQYYYNVLSDLHSVVASYPQLVNQKDLWYKNTDALGRKTYCAYVKQSHVKVMTNYTDKYDHLFSLKSSENGSHLAKTAQGIEIKSRRDNVIKTDNPFNIRITLNDFSYTMVSIYKLLSKVVPTLPSPSSNVSFTQLFNCYKELDKDFVNYRQSNHELNFQLSLNGTSFQTFEKSFDAFYTLKLYFYLFEIQKHCINSLSIQNKRVAYTKNQVSAQFNFIWANDMIESKYRQTYNEFLFQPIPDLELRQLFIDFYDQFWGEADHETNQFTNFSQIIDSAHFQYQRLYFWWKNDGNNKNKFTKIVNRYIYTHKNHFLMSKVFLFNHIMPAIESVSENRAIQQRYEYYIEVFDYFVYYLVKAICSMILSTTADFFKHMHRLQIQRCITTNTSYFLSKPGWVPFFRTMYSVLIYIEKVNDNYIIFDDEFDRISNTCFQTQQMIKNIYRQFYQKLTAEWISEMGTCLMKTPNLSSDKTAEFLLMHLAVGQSFLCAFRDYFRFGFNRSRKDCNKLLKAFERILRTHTTTVIAQRPQMFNSISVFEVYLKDTVSMERANPFESNPWQTRLAHIVSQMINLNENDLKIDLNAAQL